MAGITRPSERPTRLKRGGEDRRFTPARETIHGELPRIPIAIGFKVIDGCTQAPSPSHQHAPLIGTRPHLTLIHQADDPFGQTSGAVGLHAAGVKRRVAPALGQGERLK